DGRSIVSGAMATGQDQRSLVEPGIERQPVRSGGSRVSLAAGADAQQAEARGAELRQLPHEVEGNRWIERKTGTGQLTQQAVADATVGHRTQFLLHRNEPAMHVPACIAIEHKRIVSGEPAK